MPTNCVEALKGCDNRKQTSYSKAEKSHLKTDAGLLSHDNNANRNIRLSDLEKLCHRVLTIWFNRLQKLEYVVSVSVDDVHADGRIDVVREGVLADVTTANC